jgi:hypothetical protein
MMARRRRWRRKLAKAKSKAKRMISRREERMVRKIRTITMMIKR